MARAGSACGHWMGAILSHANMPNVRIALICSQSNGNCSTLIYVTRAALAGSAGNLR
jgi:hypothetical protein